MAAQNFRPKGLSVWISIFLGCFVMAIGYVWFINPYNIVPGGVYGASIVLHNIFPSVQVGTFGYMFDIPLMIISFIFCGSKFGVRTIVAAMTTPGLMNIITQLSYPDVESMRDLDPAFLLGGQINMTDHLMLSTLLGSVLIGCGCGIVIRQQATTGGTDIVALLMNKYLHIKFSMGILLADSLVVISGLVVIGFGIGTEEASSQGWLLSLYSLIAIFVSSKTLEYVLNGMTKNKLMFVVTNQEHSMELRNFIIKELDRSATYLNAKGMYTRSEKEMFFLVVSQKEVPMVQMAIKCECPDAFIVVTDAYDTFGEGFKPIPGKHEINL